METMEINSNVRGMSAWSQAPEGWEPHGPQATTAGVCPLHTSHLQDTGAGGLLGEEKPVSWAVGVGNNLGSGGNVAPGLLARKELGAPASPRATARGQEPDAAAVPPCRQP